MTACGEARGNEFSAATKTEGGNENSSAGLIPVGHSLSGNRFYEGNRLIPNGNLGIGLKLAGSE